MIERIEALLANNKAFVAEQLRLDPAYFDKLAEGQHPEFLWIGCSDSRVPPDRITGTRVQSAWARGQRPYLRGWVFDLGSGFIHPQTSMINNDLAMQEICKFHQGLARQAPARTA
jgi:carbonic anhydrase